jgi:hypothetical protein
MPANSAKVKVDAVREYGGQVEFVDVGTKSRAERVGELAKEHPEAYAASAYDDPHVILGNSSLDTELVLLKPLPEILGGTCTRMRPLKSRSYISLIRRCFASSASTTCQDWSSIRSGFKFQ